MGWTSLLCLLCLSIFPHKMELFVFPSFDHNCTLHGARFDDVSVITPECAPCFEGEDGGPFCEGHCFAGGGTTEEHRWRDASLANFRFWLKFGNSNSALYTSECSTMIRPVGVLT
jgi:hypothetical protein